VDDVKVPQIRSRPLRNDLDVRRVRDLLVETHSISPPGFNWEVRRWDGWRFYTANPEWNPTWESQVQLWETTEGRLVGAVNPEGSGDAHLQVHPHYRYFIEDDMFAWAEEHLARQADAGGRQLAVAAFEYDRPRQLLLEKRGYQKLDAGGTFYLLRFGLQAMPEPQLAAGYQLRETQPGSVEDAQKLADLLNAAFRRDIHNAEEYLVFAEKAPCFRHDLDLVAEAPDGSFASYVGLPYDEHNRYAIFEPVCTHPDHLQKGLAQALMWEALRRARTLGAVSASTETGMAVAANRLYESIGFTETYQIRVWRRSGLV
jgi:GNAT superfamily N-acetyltransferase